MQAGSVGVTTQDTQNSHSGNGAQAAAELQSLREEFTKLTRQLESALDRRRELEEQIRMNPDTALPIYREFQLSLDKLIRFYEGEDVDEEMDGILDVLDFPDASKDKEQAPTVKKFAVAMIRLDANYQRIRNNVDRNKVLLFKTTIRIREVVGNAIYQSDRIDEFFVVIQDYPSSEHLYRMVSSIAREVAKPHEAPVEGLSFGCHIGLCEFPHHGTKTQELLANLEIALRYAVLKKKIIVEFSDRLGQAFHRSLRLEQDLKTASQNGFENLFLVYQPFVNADNQICGCESLIRWKHPELGFIPPPQFIPIAERTGSIRIFGRWTLYKSCLQLREWHKQGWPKLYVSVNLSPVQFTQRDIVQNISDLLQATGLTGDALKLEVTEGAIMTDPDDAVKKLESLRRLGIHISIDDFGTGYSSLNYLRKLPIDTLKIDKSFIDDVTQNVQNQEIVRAIISMAQSLRIETLAEGVETKEQRDFLIKQGCQYIQGYYFSKPVESPVFSKYLEKGGVLPQ